MSVSRLRICSLTDERAIELTQRIYGATLAIVQAADAENGWGLNAIQERVMLQSLLTRTAGLIRLAHDVQFAKAS